MTPELSRKRVEALAYVLAEHGPSGIVNSREGWVECECGKRLYLRSGLTFDGYAEMWDEERAARNLHLAQALLDSPAVRDLLAEVWEEGHTTCCDDRCFSDGNPYASDEQELCHAIMTPGRHWGPDRCLKEKGHIERDKDWHLGENGAAWADEASV